jgi:hypothetical protein
MAQLNTYIRPNAINVLMVQMDEDDSGTVSTAEILAYINGQDQFYGQNFFTHINGIVPPMIMTAANINPFDVNGNGEFDQEELLNLFHSLMMHLASTYSQGNAMNAFHGYQMMITAFNNRFDGAPPAPNAAPNAAPVVTPPALSSSATTLTAGSVATFGGTGAVGASARFLSNGTSWYRVS